MASALEARVAAAADSCQYEDNTDYGVGHVLQSAWQRLQKEVMSLDP